ncbi:GTPase HflX [Bacteroidales bacterium MB20-C3-3]|jgi:GTP-binding protein HflX (EC 3.1.5.-)|nr:GTPase HflX [Bacteroidales bacterium]MBP8677052.1 GTPase HflX [Bacteroidales bacterium]MBP9584669.1 GTPase HflX [Bacteroidales bacterium]MBP9977635.1 GTPase HflX [Bacteroidales bacterium]WRQ32289.1 GTPase HflX [Bacteroidales bacterium MB20-C3-3]
MAIIEESGLEKVVFVGVLRQNDDERKVYEYLDELAFLAETAGAVGVKTFVQRVDKPNPKTYIGSGKLDEIKAYITENDIKLVIFDDELTPSQLRNIERELECRILDRTNLILDIFAQRAKTAYAKTQVELAQYQYLLPRLTRMWTHLERQRGGIGMRGPGESQIETDRRIILDKISRLKEQLRKIDRQMASQRGNRGSLVRISLVGYTNVGKSTLMNLLAKSEVFAENKLFATLDTTVRKVVIENVPFLLSDTVGFIRKLPHQLVESFKSTLDEVREADILMHVVDISHPNFEEQIKVVRETLEEIGAKNKPTFLVFNKIDVYKYVPQDEFDLGEKQRENYSLDELKKSWINKENSPCIFISAKEKVQIDKLRNDIYKMVAEIHAGRYPFDNFLW